MEATTSKESEKSLRKVNAQDLFGILSKNKQYPFRFEVFDPEEVIVKDKRGWVDEMVERCVERTNLQFSGIAKMDASASFSANQSEIIGKIIIELEFNTEPRFSSEEERAKWFKSVKNAASELFEIPESYMDVNTDGGKDFKYSMLFPAVFTTVDCKAMNKETWQKEPWELAYEKSEKKKIDIGEPFFHAWRIIEWYDQCVKVYDKLSKEAEEKKEAYFTSIRRHT
ncbi:MAG: hypothetical protein ABSD68_03755 [Candidatus Micrarchaeales archaeon]|jgi:hypothetical protein